MKYFSTPKYDLYKDCGLSTFDAKLAWRADKAIVALADKLMERKALSLDEVVSLVDEVYPEMDIQSFVKNSGKPK